MFHTDHDPPHFHACYGQHAAVIMIEDGDPNVTATSDQQLVTDVVEAIVDEVHPDRIVLFGSRAKGTASSDSDLDLLVVERRAFGPGRDRWNEIRRIRRALAKFRVPKDILVYSSDEVEMWRNAQNHVIAEGLRTGKVVYERS